MNKTRFLLLPAFALCLAALPAQAQVVDVTEGPARRIDRDERESAAPLDQPPFAHLYINLMPGQPTAIADPESGPAAHQYAAYDVVVSVASKALYSDTRDSRRRDLAALNDLRRMSVHVRFEGLAADKATVLETSRHDPSVLALHMSPSNVTYGQAAQEGAGETTAKRVITGASHFLGPLGGLVNTFIGARHHPAGPSFFSYQSEDNEFGWNWYLSPNQTIEGIHKGSVLMQKRANVAFVRVTIDLVTDWEHHGLWTKPYTFLVAIPPASQHQP